MASSSKTSVSVSVRINCNSIHVFPTRAMHQRHHNDYIISTSETSHIRVRRSIAHEFAVTAEQGPSYLSELGNLRGKVSEKGSALGARAHANLALKACSTNNQIRGCRESDCCVSLQSSKKQNGKDILHFEHGYIFLW
jgi:hypothetical protein